jgi:hypothetical protein
MGGLAVAVNIGGLEVNTVADIIGDKAEGIKPFVMPVLPDYPVSWPGEGIFFGMDDAHYHAIPAFSNSGFKKFAASPMLFWSTAAWLNPEFAEMKAEQAAKREKDGADHFEFGHAFECRILEGRERFYERFGVALDRKDYPNAVKSGEEITAAFPPGITPRGKTLADKFAHLKTLDATVEYWPDLLAAHAKANEGKYLMPARVFRSMEFAALVIERDPEIGPILKSAQPQVVICYIDPATGIPMKMKADALKVKMILDIKTLTNRNEINIDRAVDNEISSRRYAFQAVGYEEGTAAGRELVRRHGAAAVFQCSRDEKGTMVIEPGAGPVEWALKWASHRKRDQFMFLFYVKGWAPIARGVMWPYAGTHSMIARDTIRSTRSRFRQFADECGTEPWLDIKPVRDLADEDLRDYASEI